MDQGHAEGAGPAQRSVEIGVTIAMARCSADHHRGQPSRSASAGAPKDRSRASSRSISASSSSRLQRRQSARGGAQERRQDFRRLGPAAAGAGDHVPTTVYVAVIPWIGIYVSSLLLIAVFMMWLGSYRAGTPRSRRDHQSRLPDVREMVPRAAAQGADRGLPRPVT